MSETYTYILCLGSNTADKVETIAGVQDKLNEICVTLNKSDIYEAPDESGLGEPYLNMVMEVTSILPLHMLRDYLKNLEKSFGRTPESKCTGVMPLDADIIIFNDEIIDRYQYSREYFQRGYRIISK